MVRHNAEIILSKMGKIVIVATRKSVLVVIQKLVNFLKALRVLTERVVRIVNFVKSVRNVGKLTTIVIFPNIVTESTNSAQETILNKMDKNVTKMECVSTASAKIETINVNFFGEKTLNHLILV